MKEPVGIQLSNLHKLRKTCKTSTDLTNYMSLFPTANLDEIRPTWTSKHISNRWSDCFFYKCNISVKLGNFWCFTWWNAFKRTRPPNEFQFIVHPLQMKKGNSIKLRPVAPNLNYLRILSVNQRNAFDFMSAYVCVCTCACVYKLPVRG